MTLSERLERAMASPPDGRARTKSGLAAACGIKGPSVTQWFNGRTKQLEGSNLLSAARYLGVTPEWLATGKGAMWAADLSTGPSTETRVSIHKAESAGEIAAGYVRFPLLDGFVAAGEGGYVADYPEVVRELDLAEEWVRRNIAAPVERVRVITAQGDSMAPDIGSGDVLFVDSGITWFDADAIYVMNWRGRPIVKRLQMRRDGSLLIRSTNAAYGEEVVPAGEEDQLYISGRVVGVWAFRKY